MYHHVFVIHLGDKDLITAQIAARNGKTILFVKIQCGADRLAGNLVKAGVPIDTFHGGKSQAVSTRILKLFKEEEKAALVATEVTICNIYVDGTSLVVRVEAPTDHIDYLQRSGCTVRAGESRGVVVLVTTKQQTSAKGVNFLCRCHTKIVTVKLKDSELMTITGSQEPSEITCLALIAKSRKPYRSGGKSSRLNSSQRRRSPW